MPAEILIVFASGHGHTGRIAARIADRLEAAGANVDVVPVDGAAGVEPRDKDRGGVRGSIHMARHSGELIDWARHHARRLNARPSAFFSVCLALADGTDDSRRHAEDWIADFEEDTGWMPRRRAAFAGALQYSRYDRATRLFMRLMMARGGHPTDIRTDVEYTDWDAVDAFADSVAALLGPVLVGQDGA
jgi:menaquinone-dependent protoporphyrinogen oxidase